MKYKRLYERKFEKRTGFFMGIEVGDYAMCLLFEGIPMTMLHVVADELINDGFCNKAEVSEDKIEMIEWEMLFCSEEELKDIISEVLKEHNYELVLK